MTLFFTELQKAHKHKMFCCKPFRPIWTEKMTYISIPNLIHRSATLWGYCTPFFIQNNLNYYHMTQMWHIIYWIFVFKNLHCGENLQYFPYDKVPQIAVAAFSNTDWDYFYSIYIHLLKIEDEATCGYRKLPHLIY